MSRRSNRSQGTGQFRTIVLENEHIRVIVIPELGGRVWQLEDRIRRREWIWHRISVPLCRPPDRAVYDDVWAGGWEELFPNDAPVLFEGRDLPDHGEWWALSWDVEAVSADAVRLTTNCSVINARCSKEIRIAGDEPRVSITYRIVSLEQQPFHFLFKQHLPVRITPACRLNLPGGCVQAVDSAFGTLLSNGGPCNWPDASDQSGREVDLQVVRPASSRDQEFLYVKELPRPWCGVDDYESMASLRMSFDEAVFPYVWLFISYGGWRDTYTAVLEPCTNVTKDLGEAVRRGQSALLAPGQEFVATVSVVLSQLQTESAAA